jgi:glutamine amidotransferase PdxT
MRTVPGYERTCRGVTLGNDVVPDVRQTITLELKQIEVKTNALGRKRASVQYTIHSAPCTQLASGMSRCVNKFVKSTAT